MTTVDELENLDDATAPLQRGVADEVGEEDELDRALLEQAQAEMHEAQVHPDVPLS